MQITGITVVSKNHYYYKTAIGVNVTVSYNPDRYKGKDFKREFDDSNAAYYTDISKIYSTDESCIVIKKIADYEVVYWGQKKELRSVVFRLDDIQISLTVPSNFDYEKFEDEHYKNLTGLFNPENNDNVEILNNANDAITNRNRSYIKD